VNTAPKGTTIYTILRQVSRSGMTRHIGLVVIGPTPDVIFHPNYSASKLLEMRQDKRDDGLIVGGCGMDMGFHVVYELASAVWGDGYAYNQRCSDALPIPHHRAERGPVVGALERRQGRQLRLCLDCGRWWLALYFRS